MDNKLMVEEWTDFISGQVITLKHICAAIVAVHPQRAIILQLANNILGCAREANASGACIAGIEDISETLSAMLNSVMLAGLERSMGPDKELH